MSFEPTPSQTVGPYMALGLPWEEGPVADPAGVRISGRVLDGAGDAVADALVETWQVSPPAFTRCPTGDDGGWSVVVPRPACVGDQAPHWAVSVFARGLLRRLVTRIYLPEHVQAIAVDPVLMRVAPGRRETLVASRSGDGYRFDIRMQGRGETVFFDV